MIHHTSCQETARTQTTDHQQPQLLMRATQHLGLVVQNMQPYDNYVVYQCQELFPNTLWAPPSCAAYRAMKFSLTIYK